MKSHTVTPGRAFTQDPLAVPGFLSDPDRPGDPACNPRNAWLFHPPDSPDGRPEPVPLRRLREERAKAVCARCPLAAACGRHVAAHPDRGVWAGRTEKERALPATAAGVAA